MFGYLRSVMNYRLKHVFFFSFQANQHQNYYRPAVPEDQNFGDGDLDSISDLSVSAYSKNSKKNISKKVWKFYLCTVLKGDIYLSTWLENLLRNGILQNENGFF